MNPTDDAADDTRYYDRASDPLTARPATRHGRPAERAVWALLLFGGASAWVIVMARVFGW